MHIAIIVALVFAIVGTLLGAIGTLVCGVIGLLIGLYIGFGECEGPVYRFFFSPRPQKDDVPVLTEAV